MNPVDFYPKDPLVTRLNLKTPKGDLHSTLKWALMTRFTRVSKFFSYNIPTDQIQF